MNKIYIPFLSLLFCLLSCSDSNKQAIQQSNINNDDTNDITSNYKILSLGDSYTIGQSVCETCRFPVQLRDSLNENLSNSIVSVDIIAQTGWTTTNLIDAIENENVVETYDLVTLLIGVNNQYQNRPFNIYEEEFPILVNTAISLANGEQDKVIVISIPDYAFTPFGQVVNNTEQISEEIDQYNDFAFVYCVNNGITFINITDITRQGIDNPELVAADNLHPSELAYSKFVERILPTAIEKIQQ
jgi:lysophospholipase L1-like esterase